MPVKKLRMLIILLLSKMGQDLSQLNYILNYSIF
jgi:hypothetical protein